MFANKKILLAAFLIPAFALAQQMPMSKPLAPPPVVQAPAIPAPKLPASLPKQDVIKSTDPVASNVPAPSGFPTKQVSNAGSPSIQQIAEIQRRQLAAEAEKKLGFQQPALPNSTAPISLPSAYKAPKIYPKLEYIAGLVGQEAAGMRMPDGRLVILQAGETIGQWEVKKMSSGKMYLEAISKSPAQKRKTMKKTSSKTPIRRVMDIGDSLK